VKFSHLKLDNEHVRLVTKKSTMSKYGITMQVLVKCRTDNCFFFQAVSSSGTVL
jgi:hypothetical protein